jgi:outer membrane immunogenic protein
MRKIVIPLLAGTALTVASGAGFAADLPAKVPVYKAPASVEVYGWQGFYMGGHLGYGWSDKDWVFLNNGATTSHTANGFIGGIQLGYNWNIAPNWVLGIEGEITWSDMNGSNACPNPAYSCKTEINWLATVAGRLGYSFDRALIYVKGGGAWADEDYSATGPTSYTASNTRAGWLIGVGAEYAFTPAWSAKIEYNYIDFGKKTADLVDGTGTRESTDVDQTISLVKAGFNYRFGR